MCDHKWIAFAIRPAILDGMTRIVWKGAANPVKA